MVALCAALAVLAPGSGAAPAAPDANSATFQDSTGEDALGPDVASVTVANDNLGSLTFTVNIPNRPTFTGDMDIVLFVDSDSNATTGDQELLGADYVIELNAFGGPAGIALLRWNGSDFTSTGVPQTSLIFSYANGVTIKIKASELGATKKFSFGVFAVSGLVITPSGDIDDTNAHVDLAPDPGHGFFSYEVKLTPATLVVRSSGSRPVTPKAGTAYSVFAVVARSDGAAIGTGTVSCKASLGSAPLRATGSFAGGRATCSVAVPKTAKGKTIRVSISVVSDGLKASRSFTARVG